MAVTSQRNPVATFVSGEIPLARMFWLHGVVAGFAAGMALGGLGGISTELQRVWAVLLLAYILAWYIGLWRSADRYAGPAVWKWAARAVVAMPFMGVLFALVLSAGTAKRAAISPAAASHMVPPAATQPQQVVPQSPIPVTIETQSAPVHQTENPFRDPNYGKEIATQQQTAPPAVPVATQPPAPSAQEAHFQKIYAAHPDADAVFTSTGFQDWLSQNPKYQRVPKEGSTQEVIAMFTEFKRALATPLKKWDAATVQRNEAAAETLSRQYNPTYPR